MQREMCTPRANWEEIVESQGFHFHTLDEQPYWDESACYSFSIAEIAEIEKATYALNEMCLQAAEAVFRDDRLGEFGIPDAYQDWLRESWDNDERTIYGRFDFGLAPDAPPKMLEYNADTPTALLEAAVIQWHWLEETRPGADQFNSIHERLIEAWQSLPPGGPRPVFFTALAGNIEDYMTVNYLRDTAIQAGLETDYLDIERITWDESSEQFRAPGNRNIELIFKLYPWEWMLNEAYGPNLLKASTRWLEAPWKMILSSKMILPVLWEMYPESPYLLPTGKRPLGASFVRKPLRSREGANVAIIHDGQVLLETDGPYSGPFIFQEVCPIQSFDGMYPVIGSWMVNGHACGIGIREDDSLVTQNTSRFIPHYIP